MTDFINSLQDVWNGLPPELWLFIGSSIGVSVVVQKFKKWLSLDQNRWILTLLMLAVSSIPVVASYVMTDPSLNGLAYSGVGIAAIMGGAMTFYNTFGKYIINILNDAKALREQRVVQVNNDAAVNAVQVTPEQTANIFE